MLVFLYHHQATLVGALAIAHLLGYASEPIVAALDVLEFLGFVDRSQVSETVRLYQFTVPSNPERRDAWLYLLALVSRRTGRVHLAKRLHNNIRLTQRLRPKTHDLITEVEQYFDSCRQEPTTPPLLLPDCQGVPPWRKAI